MILKISRRSLVEKNHGNEVTGLRAIFKIGEGGYGLNLHSSTKIS
jgi:hypothetical protein